MQVITTALETTDARSQVHVVDHDAPRLEGLKIGVPSSSATPAAHPSIEIGMSFSWLIIDRTPS